MSLSRIKKVFFSVSIYLFCLLCFFSPAFADYDAELIDTLVKKSIISEDEASVLKKEYVALTVCAPDTKAISVTGIMQVKYEHFSYNQDMPDHGDFFIRRMMLRFTGDISESISAGVFIDLANERTKYLDRVFISKKFENAIIEGTVLFGYYRPNFCYEYMMQNPTLPCPERSMANYYWSGRELGNEDDKINTFRSSLRLSRKRTGIYHFANIKEFDGMYYSAAITNPHGDLAYPTGGSYPALWFGMGQKIDVNETSFLFGFNSVYIDEFSPLAESGTTFVPSFPIDVYDYGEIASANAYFKISHGNFYIMSDLNYAYVQHGRTVNPDTPVYTTNSSAAFPWGATATIAYKINLGEYGDIEPVFRFSYMNTDGRGTQTNHASRGSKNLGTLYNKGCEFYIGANYYIIDDTVKIQFGYQRSVLENCPISTVDKNAEIDYFVIQVQTLF